MFEGLDQAQLSGAIEAMLFVTDEPVGVIELADMLEADPKLVEQALVDLREKLEREQRGIQLREVAGGWRLYTHPAYHDLVEKYVLSWDTRKLSQAAMETLAIVAYLQPCTCLLYTSFSQVLRSASAQRRLYACASAPQGCSG